MPEPNTWRELLAAIRDRPERRIAVQEYGRPNAELLAGLRQRGVTLALVVLAAIVVTRQAVSAGPLLWAGGGQLERLLTVQRCV